MKSFVAGLVCLVALAGCSTSPEVRQNSVPEPVQKVELLLLVPSCVLIENGNNAVFYGHDSEGHFQRMEIVKSKVTVALDPKRKVGSSDRVEFLTESTDPSIMPRMIKATIYACHEICLGSWEDMLR